MDKDGLSNGLNGIIDSINDVDQELMGMMIVSDIPILEKITLNSEYNLQAYQEIEKAFNFAVQAVNTLVNISWKLGVVDIITGEIVKKIKALVIHDIQELSVATFLNDKLLEIQNKFNEVKKLFITYGYIKERK